MHGEQSSGLGAFSGDLVIRSMRFRPASATTRRSLPCARPEGPRAEAEGLYRRRPD